MGQNQRRPGFLRWGEGSRSESAEATVDVAEQEATENMTPQQGSPETPSAAAGEAMATANEPAPETAGAVEPMATTGSEATPFLRDLVGAMRGVAESSRDTSLAELHEAVEKRLEQLGSGAAARAEELRRGSERDLDGIGEWERTELERVRREAEQRREARRAQLEKELADHQAAADADVEATRARLAQYEQELDAFFAQLSTINDPAAFVSAAKRMPPPPDLSSAAGPTTGQAAAKEAPAATAEPPATPGEATQASDATLAERLAQLNERLGTAPAATETGGTEMAASEAAAPAATAPAVTAAVTPPTPSSNGSAAEASTPIVVKGLGSFGAITSFKQALERVDGISGVTLSLGPTGDFVYRASHAPEFDVVAAIRSIEGSSAGIEQVDGQLRVTIERPR